jgi:hypothetical protein
MADTGHDQVHAGDTHRDAPPTHDVRAYGASGSSEPRGPPARLQEEAPSGPPFKLWVGGFRLETQQDQVRDAFGKFGEISHCW